MTQATTSSPAQDPLTQDILADIAAGTSLITAIAAKNPIGFIIGLVAISNSARNTIAALKTDFPGPIEFIDDFFAKLPTIFTSQQLQVMDSYTQELRDAQSQSNSPG